MSFDMAQHIESDSSQLNAVDFPTPMTFRITGGRSTNSKEQPVELFLDGASRPWRPCLTMRRLLLAMWGRGTKGEYNGRLLTLYSDSNVTYGGKRTGGIRITAASHLEHETFKKVLMVRRNKYEEFVVRRLDNNAPTFDQRAADLLDKVCERLNLTADDLDEWMNDMGKPKLSMAAAEARQRVAQWLTTDAGVSKLDEWRKSQQVATSGDSVEDLQSRWNAAPTTLRESICADAGWPMSVQVADLSEEDRGIMAAGLAEGGAA